MPIKQSKTKSHGKAPASQKKNDTAKDHRGRMFDHHELTGGKKVGKHHIAKTKPESEYDHLGDQLAAEVRAHKKDHHHPHHHHGHHIPEKLVPLPTSPSTKSEPTSVTRSVPLPTSSPPLTPPTKERRILHDPGTHDHSRRHASQLVPSYGEYVFGQGDPLLQAVIEYTNMVAWNASKSAVFPVGHSTPPSSKKTKEELPTHLSPGAVVDHLIEHDETFVSSPLGMNDIVHLANGGVLSIPCVPSMDDDHHYEPLVEPHTIDPGSPLSKIGMKGMTYLDYHN
mmetsp:Transcript_16254/g.39895  ORF Transcript_16254/g.39895 Transcript_16254/m.39895 type:complete len:282 (+) Transcript_16254:336-1181(+)